MNTGLLIEALVRQTMVLIATLAATTGERSPLSRVADQVFANLVAELKAQGVGNKLIADMFGMALRTYHYRMARVAESATDRGRSVWEAVLGHIQQHGVLLRTDVLRRFQRDDPEVVRSVLRDLVDARLVYRTGRGEQTVYRAATDLPEPSDRQGAVKHLLLVAIHRAGPIARSELARLLPLSDHALDGLLAELVAEGRARARDDGGVTTYECDSVLVHYGDAAGWQAALFDHYQAMVVAICTKMRRGDAKAGASDEVGGSTYHFDIWPGHPLEHEVRGLLGELRTRALALCERVQAVNAQSPLLGERQMRAVAYVGQCVLDQEENSRGENDDD